MCVGRNHSESPLTPIRIAAENFSVQENLKLIPNGKPTEDKMDLKEDILATMTRQTKVLFNMCNEMYNKHFLGSTLYK